jgi:hypothetical protein
MNIIFNEPIPTPPLNVVINAYKIFILSRYHTNSLKNIDLSIDITTSIHKYFLNFITEKRWWWSCIIGGEPSVVLPLPSSTYYTYYNMKNFIPLYNIYLELATKNGDKINQIDDFINFSRYNLSKSDKFVCDCCSYYSGVNYFIFECFSYIINNLDQEIYKRLCNVIENITYIFDDNMKSMLIMNHSCLHVKEDVIMIKTLKYVNSHLEILRRVDENFTPVLEHNRLYTYMYRLFYYTELFERIEDRWCPYKYLNKNINQIISHDSNYDPSYKRILKHVNDNLVKNGTTGSITCKDCAIIQDIISNDIPDLTLYNTDEVYGVFTDMKQILVDMYIPSKI